MFFWRTLFRHRLICIGKWERLAVQGEAAVAMQLWWKGFTGSGGESPRLLWGTAPSLGLGVREEGTGMERRKRLCPRGRGPRYHFSIPTILHTGTSKSRGACPVIVGDCQDSGGKKCPLT